MQLPVDPVLNQLNEKMSTIMKEELKYYLEPLNNRGRSDWGQLSPLYCAIQNRRQDLIEVMVKRFGIRIDSFFDTYYGGCRTQNPQLTKSTALSHAASTQNEEMVRFLVDKMGAKVNINTEGTTPLIAAIRSGFPNLPMVELLVKEFKADVNFEAKKRGGSSPYLALHAAISAE